MMRKILILALATFSLSALAQNAAEEALILNQELQFLEDSVNSSETLSFNSLQPAENRAINDEGLERTYFGESQEDSVSTRTAGPKRRKN